MTAPVPSDLAADTAVHRLPAAPGWYTAQLPPCWNFATPSGGVLMTVAMRAMVEELARPELQPVSATTVFCSPVPDGPLEIRVEILRAGGMAAQLRAALSSTRLPGPGLEVTATFARQREAPGIIDVEPPRVEPHATAIDLLREEEGAANPMRQFPVFANFDLRLALGEPPWQHTSADAPARNARWFRYRVPQRMPDGWLDPLALLPIADTMPGALFRKLGDEGGGWIAPSLDLTVHFLQPTRSEWLMTSCWSRHAAHGYATAEVEIWSDEGRLVAYGTQMMILRRLPSPG